MRWSRPARMLGVAPPGCPSCREAGDLHPGGSFEDRGTLADSSEQVLRCRNCGAGLKVSRSRLTRRRRLDVIDSGTWGRMEDDWYRAHPISDPSVPEVAPPEPRELVERLREAGLEGDPLVFLVAEAASIEEDEARRILDAEG